MYNDDPLKWIKQNLGEEFDAFIPHDIDDEVIIGVCAFTSSTYEDDIDEGNSFTTDWLNFSLLQDRAFRISKEAFTKKGGFPLAYLLVEGYETD